MKCQRRGSDLSIQCSLAAHKLGVEGVSAGAKIDDKTRFLKVANRLIEAETLIRDLLGRIDSQSGAGIMDADEHSAMAAKYASPK